MAHANDPSDDPFSLVWSLCERQKTKGTSYFKNILNTYNHMESDINERRAELRQSSRTKSVTYMRVNPLLTLNALCCALDIPEHLRLRLTRFRTSSHNLAIETGRWSRIEPEKRLCECGFPQTEDHVLCASPRTCHLRSAFQLDYSKLDRILDNPDIRTVCDYVNKCLNELNR